MYRIGICDDGENICTEIENTIRAYAQEHEIEMEIDTWNSGEHLCRNLEQGEELDLLFLDIELISLTGIDVGNFIRNGMDNRGMQIVYISSHATYAQQFIRSHTEISCIFTAMAEKSILSRQTEQRIFMAN
jgi:DNA-binding LytR/AlgR family response regulator